MQNWKHVHGSQLNMPAEFDTTSSKNYVYQRRNVKRISVQNLDGSTSELWDYEERIMTRDEFAVLSEIFKTQKDIAAIEDALCSLDTVNQEV